MTTTPTPPRSHPDNHCDTCFKHVVHCDCAQQSSPASSDTTAELDRMLNEHAEAMRLGPYKAQAMRDKIIAFVLGGSTAPTASPSGAFSCAKRAADLGNERAACLKWCGDCENCYCVGCASCITPSPARSDMLDAERANDQLDALEDLRKAVKDEVSDEWLLAFVTQYPFAPRRATQGTPTGMAESAPSGDDVAIELAYRWKARAEKAEAALARRATAGTTSTAVSSELTDVRIKELQEAAPTIRDFARAIQREVLASNAGAAIPAAPACKHCDGHGSYPHKGSVVDCRVCGGTGTAVLASSNNSPVGAPQEPTK